MGLASVGEAASAAQSWWRQQIEEIPPVVQLPAGGEELAGNGAQCRLPTGFDAAVLGCVVAGLLARYNTSGRVLLTIGECGGWTAVPVDFADDPTFSDALSRWNDSYQTARSTGVSLADLADPELAGAAVTQVAVAVDATPWPLSTPPVLHAQVDGDDIRLAGKGLADGVAEQVAGHLAALAAAWTPQRRLSEVAILAGPERAALLVGASGPHLDLPANSVWELIRAAGRLAPQAPALVDDTGRISYGDLVTRVEALAGELSEGGLGRGALVGLCVPRSIHMVVGLLAIMCSGAAYVPIDPSYPPDRIATMFEDAELAALVTEPGQDDGLPHHALPVVFVSGERPSTAAATAGDRNGPSPDDLAYVIFTSGSTGRPKGVMIGHQALTNFVMAIAHQPGMTAHDRLLAVTTLSFDIAALELLVPLSVGGCVVVAGRDTVLDPAALAARLDDEAITVMQATPATWRMLVDWGWAGRKGLRVLCGGEALPVALAATLVDRCDELWNMYGPTETTIWSLATRLRVGDDVSIGSPIANTSVYVTGAHQELLPDGIAGELLIGGMGLAEGYLGQPDLTASRFIPDQFSPVADGRLYRTGDLVRRRTDATLDFIGRIDHQVKVRGFRIELGEVETALDAAPAVARSVAVVAPDAVTGTNQLIAYVVLHSVGETGGTELRRYLAQRLPDYMVPSAIIVLEVFPLTLNGKIDRKALPAPGPVTHRSALVEPRTALERELVELWEATLLISPIGVTDEVFELGASSLTTARLYAAVGRAFDVTLPIAAAFQASTVERLAELIEDVRQARVTTSSYAALVPIRPTGSRRPLFLVHGGAGTVLLFEPLARHLGDDQPVFALQAVGLYGAQTPQRTIGDMARLYIEEMTSVQPHGPYRIGGYCFGALVAFEMASQLLSRGEQTELLMTFNGPSPSYLRRYRPLFDADGARTDESGQVLRRPSLGVSDRARIALASQRSPVLLTVRMARRGARLARVRLRRYHRRLKLRLALALHRPLPDALREAGAFQRLAAKAQDRYQPSRYPGTMLVIRASDLYYQDDLGWSDYVDGGVEVFDVPGSTITPRMAMTDEFVAPVVDAVSIRLDGLDRLDGRSAGSVRTRTA